MQLPTLRMLRRLFLLPVLFLLAGSLHQGCIITQLPKTGDDAMKEMQYSLAVQLYMEELGTEQNTEVKARKSFLIAECYRKYLADFPNAEIWYKKAIDLNYDPIATFDYALSLKANEKYPEAIVQLNNYIAQNPADDAAREELKACTLAVGWKSNPVNMIIENISSLNSPAYDYEPVPYDKGAIVFSSDRSDATGSKTFMWTNEKFSDLYISYNDGKGNFGAPVAFSPIINSAFNEGAVTFSKDFTECYFTRSGSDDENAGDYCKIYYCSKTEGGDWSEPVVVPMFDDSTNVSQPFLSADGKELYVSSDAKGGYGDKDLYVLHRTEEGWGPPENLGPEVNTAGKEGFPSIGPDGKLYFASDGHPGMGGLDLFSAVRANGHWGKVENLKAPLNSGSDDFGIVFYPVKPEDALTVKANGLFTSNRPGGKGNDDIYHFSVPKTHLYALRGQVNRKVLEDPSDPNSPVKVQRPLPNTEVNLVALDEKGSPLLSTITDIHTDAQGRFFVMIDAEKNYKLSYSHENYYSVTGSANSFGFSRKDQDTVFANTLVALDSVYKTLVDVGKRFGGKILYGLDSANIRPSAAKVLDSLVVFLQQNPDIRFELGSHTDSRGSAESNMALSQRRADSAVAYLVRHGIDPHRIIARGYGETMIMNGCVDGVPCSEEQHQANRRTTLRQIDDSEQEPKNQLHPQQ